MVPRRYLLLAPFAALSLVPFAPGRQEPGRQEPAPSPPATAKVVPGTPVRHPLEGVYELRRRTIAGRPEARPSRGYLAITRRHMFVCLAGPGTDDDQPLLRAGVRTWSQKDDTLESVVALGWYTDADGGVHVETPGAGEKRRVTFERGVLRIHQDALNNLEFERVE